VVARRLSQLTTRERDVVALIARGYSNRMIADELVIANSTAERHVANILRKLSARSRAEVAVLATEAGSTGKLGNLPTQVSSFVGRDHEVRELVSLLSTTRLLTLTGPGGIGKTRLALQLAAIVAPSYAEGCWLVQLDELNEPELVANTLAAALNIRELPGTSLVDSMVNGIQERRLLVVLDNCEHVVQACARLSATLLAACANLQILATSREPLQLTGETTWRLAGLGVPRRAEAGAVDETASSEAGQLFLDRARGADPQFVLDEPRAHAIADICHRLDGIPLALELAAVWVRMLDVRQIAARLDDRSALLVGGNRAAPPRQQTLRATLDWSYQLLSEHERRVFEYLSVFAAGWTLEAAEATCACGQVNSSEILTLLAQLVDRSLVVAHNNVSGQVRYRMLEVVRQYARDRLSASADAEVIRRAHAEYYLRLAACAQPELMGPDQGRWLDCLEQEQENIRATLQWAIDTGDAELGLQLATAIWMFWSIHGDLSEGRLWFEKLLRPPVGADPASAATRAGALCGAGVLAMEQGEYSVATALLRDSLVLSRELKDADASAWCLFNLARVANDQCEYRDAAALVNDSLRLFRDAGDTIGMTPAVVLLGMVAAVQGDYEQAAALAAEGLVLGERCENNLAIASSLCLMALVARDRGDAAAAATSIEKSLGLFHGLGDKLMSGYAMSIRGMIARDAAEYDLAANTLEQALVLLRAVGARSYAARALTFLGSIALARGDSGQATAVLDQAYTLARSVGDRCAEAMALEEMASVAYASGDTQSARRQLESARALRTAIGAPLPPVDDARLQRMVATISQI
jgi:non-specific serine/threonine protein kinase